MPALINESYTMSERERSSGPAKIVRTKGEPNRLRPPADTAMGSPLDFDWRGERGR